MPLLDVAVLFALWGVEKSGADVEQVWLMQMRLRVSHAADCSHPPFSRVEEVCRCCRCVLDFDLLECGCCCYVKT